MNLRPAPVSASDWPSHPGFFRYKPFNQSYSFKIHQRSNSSQSEAEKEGFLGMRVGFKKKIKPAVVSRQNNPEDDTAMVLLL